ncbi:tyrosine-type recombinase/integrase [Nocardia australiensis]|uniref:tyrosine-type recombinase/integrase n=1 Tax=Nocardia australiensis TaxID=2887191 RepID=UPI001D1500C5|nr:site-specific integrase [Nocardia australiensis]
MTTPKKQTFKTPGKKRKRQYGQGSIYRRANGLYCGYVSLPPGPDGKRRRTPPVYSMDRNTVTEMLEEVKENLRKGILPSPKKKVSVTEWMLKWAEIKKPEWAPRYYKTVLSTINQQITPSIGGADVKTLTPDHIRYMIDWIDGQTKEGKVERPDGTVELAKVPKWSTRTTQVAYDRIHLALEDAKRQRPPLVRENVAALVKRPKAISATGEHHTAEQARAVLEAALEWGDPYVTLWATRYLTGLRQGELLGLTSERIDFDELTIDVSWQLQWLPLLPGMKNSDAPGRFDAPPTYEITPLYKAAALVKPKTDKPRIIPMPAELAVLLKIYVQNQVPNHYGLLWVSEQFRPIQAKDDTAAWNDAQARAEVPQIRGHGTRHTANTLLPVDEVTRMQILGHSTAAANRLYLHADLGKLRTGMGALAGMLLPEKIVPTSQRP